MSAVVLWVGYGRIAGISCIVGGLMGAGEADVLWRIAFLLGLVGAPLAYAAVVGAPVIMMAATPGIIIAAGLLVGFRTRLGGGCTSGHGVRAMARFSRGSVVATGTFMATAMVTVFLVRHLAGG